MKRLALVLIALSLLALPISNSWAQSGDVVISTNTTWSAGSYQLHSLIVTNGATLTLQGANTTAQVGGQWAGYGVTIYADSVQIDAGSKISADGQGYAGGPTGGSGRGPGGGGGSIFYDAAGGSYGGLGYSSPTLSAGSVYGSGLTPTDLGSGGGGATRCAGGECYSDPAGGNGGGAIRLIVAGTLTNDGTISANGAAAPANWPPALDSYAGGGSGGSIWVTAGNLSGAGSFTASGGPRYWNGEAAWPSGGGGRIAVYYGADQAFSGFDSSVAPGGPGADFGTVVFINTTSNDLMVAGGQRFLYREDSSIAFHDVTVRSGASLTIGGGSTISAGGTIWVTGNSRFILQGKGRKTQVNSQWAGQGVTLSALNVLVDAGSAITASGQGYSGGATGASGSGPGGGGGSTLYDSAGGSYGGLGYSSQNLSAGPIYGNQFAPIDLGSGGGGATRCAGGECYSDPAGGNGGGAIRLIVTGTLTNNGTISADGAAAPPNWPPSLDTYACAGAGGSIWATIATLTGAGSFMANGGPHYWNGVLGAACGGGGGRVAVYYSVGDSYTGFDSSTANGGPGAQAGTLAFFNTNDNDLVVTAGQNFVIPPDATLAFADITVRDQATLVVGGGANLTATGTLLVTGNSKVVVQGKNPAWQISGQWAGQGATLSATNLQVDAGSSINSDGQGYAGGVAGEAGAGPGGGGGTTGYDSAGGSYGGLGFSTQCCTAGPTYGSATAPIDLGSGGGFAAGYAGGAGGGAIRLIVSGTLTNNGTISSNGGNGQGYSGGGAGGSLWATLGTLTGAGTFAANGGSRDFFGSLAYAGGGGGRIAIYYGTNRGFNPDSVIVNGGVSAHVGTITFEPATVQVTVSTSPAGLSFSVDGTGYTSAQTFTWDSEGAHTIATDSPQAAVGTRYQFSAWSDGGALSHQVTASPATTSYTATFTTGYLLTTAVAPAESGTITASPASSDGYYAANTSVQLTAAANPGYAFANFSGELTGSTNPQSVVMSSPRSITANFAGFALSTPDSQTVSAGSTASYSIAVTPLGAFSQAVTFSCSGLPSHASCTFSPASVTPSGSAVNTTLGVATTATTTAQCGLHRSRGAPVYALWFPLLGLGLMSAGLQAKRFRPGLLILLLLALALGALVLAGGCGTGSSCTPTTVPGTAAGTYNITVTGSSATLQRTTTVTLTVR